jgi:hypothetical protein
MIIFYPRDIGMWRKDFDFHPGITLIPKEKTDHKAFRNREELIEFLKDHGVRLDDPAFPLKFEQVDQTGENVYFKGYNYQGELSIVVQWSVIGWIRDDHR